MARLLVSGREEDFRRRREPRCRVFMEPKTKPKKNNAPSAQQPKLAIDVNAPEALPPRRLTGLLSKALRGFEQKFIHDDGFKPTFAEYLKLLQLERELETDLPREITVTWIEPAWASKEE